MLLLFYLFLLTIITIADAGFTHRAQLLFSNKLNGRQKQQQQQKKQNNKTNNNNNHTNNNNFVVEFVEPTTIKITIPKPTTKTAIKKKQKNQ